MGMRRFISWQAAMRDLRNEHPAVRRQNALREAAPDLLEALKQARAVLVTVRAEPLPEIALRVIDRRIETISAVIAKAEGNHA